MRKILPLLLISLASLFFQNNAQAQLVITPQTTATALAQRLVGNGVTISNASFTGSTAMAGNFVNLGNNNIGIDSGIVLTSGRAKTIGSSLGVDGNGTQQAEDELSDNSWNLPGDASLAAAIGSPLSSLRDACILEFDFIPLGDSIKFNYVFSSEEYTTSFVCNYNDAFGFFISGPGITGQKNIALVPGTTTPVSIINVNNIQFSNPCINNPTYYVDNRTNTYFNHDGHTSILSAIERVVPCQVYHLKLVISDVVDDQFDSGVFLEAKSLTSNIFQLTNHTQTDPVSGSSYLVEGCATGSLQIERQAASNFSQTVFLGYGGTAQDITDVLPLPTSVTIPANQTTALVNIFPIIDLIPEGIENLKIYTLAGCTTGTAIPTDSAEVQIRDFDILGITPDSALICRNGTVQLTATAGYSAYAWDADATLSSTSVAAPLATPVVAGTTYYCTANVGTCNARDSAFIRFKDIEFLSQTDVNCAGATTGQIQVAAGPEWAAPLALAVNNGTAQTDSSFNNLPVGNYWVRITDASGCADSIEVNIVQTYPDLLSSAVVVAATCTGDPDGSITIQGNGGKSPYSYSIDNGITYQSSNTFSVRQGNYDVVIKDDNGCTFVESVLVGFTNDLQVDAGMDVTICEGTSTQLVAVSNADSYIWSPSIQMSGATQPNPVVSPVQTQKYYVKAIRGICEISDSLVVNVNPAPVPDAGSDVEVCFGADIAINATTGFDAYQWTPSTYLNSTTIADPTAIRPLNDTEYYLKVTDNNGCISLRYDTVLVNVTPAVQLFAGNDTIVGMNQPLQLNVVELGNSGVTTYNWSPTYGLDNPNISNPIAILDRDITYYVSGKTPANCEGNDTIHIKAYQGPEIYVPTAFTPNGDGVNDMLRAFAVGMKSYRYFKIYNRWGQAIFSTTDFSKGWDGRIKGALQPIGSYVWIAETVDFLGNNIQRKGVFTLLQ